MMKVPSLNPAAAGDFLISHIEKIVVALIGFVSLLMIWWGVSAAQWQSATSSRTPDAIAKLASEATGAIGRSSSPPPGRVPKVPSLGPRIDPWRPQQVKLGPPSARALVLNPPIASQLQKRTIPEVFPISDLRAVANVGVFFDAEAGGASAAAAVSPQLQLEEHIRPGRIAPYVVVTGLIPAAKQKAEFDSRFGAVTFRDVKLDSPRWADYIVERARVVPGAAPRWKRLPLTNVARFGTDGVPVVDPGTGAKGAPGISPDNLPPGFFLQPDEAEVQYAASLPVRVDDGWCTDAIHPWFTPQIQAMFDAAKAVSPEEGKTDDEEVVAATLAELAGKPSAFHNKEVKLAGVALDPEPRRQTNVGLYAFGVRAADQKTTVNPGGIGSNEDLVFATSEDLGRKLAFDLEGGKPRRCNLVVRVDIVGKTPVARLLVIAFIDDEGEVITTQRESAPEPIVLATEGVVLDPAQMQAANPAATAGPRSENRLFRFVDLGVEPGAQYRYRVRFALRNPNAGLALQHISDPAVAKGDFLLAAFSPETPPVRVPDLALIVARTVPRDAARKIRVKGDNIELMVLAQSEETGNFSLRSVVTSPGGVANIDPSLNRPGDTRYYGQPVATDRLLLDFRGTQEDRIDARKPVLQEPLEMLFLKPDGEFEVVTAADSELLVRRYRSTLFPPGSELPDDGKPPKPLEQPGDQP